MTTEQAIQLAASGWWQHVSPEEAAMWQLFEDKLCMPFGVFHAGVEKLLKRSVWTHEFAAADALRGEALGYRPSPTFAQILEQIPADKRIVINIDEPTQSPEKEPA